MHSEDILRCLVQPSSSPECANLGQINKQKKHSVVYKILVTHSGSLLENSRAAQPKNDEDSRQRNILNLNRADNVKSGAAGLANGQSGFQPAELNLGGRLNKFEGYHR